MPLRLLHTKVYVYLALGYAAYTFTIGGFSVFAPQFLQYTFAYSETQATQYFGGILLLTGLFGTAGGGWLLDKVRERSSAVERCGPHVAVRPAMLRSSNTEGGSWTSGGRATRCRYADMLIAQLFSCPPDCPVLLCLPLLLRLLLDHCAATACC